MTHSIAVIFSAKLRSLPACSLHARNFVSQHTMCPHAGHCMLCCPCCRFAKPFKLRCCAAFGGLQKYAQVKSLQLGQEVAVATPGRLIDLVKSQACDFKRVTMLVVDEVDRCFDLGFEAQVRTESDFNLENLGP